MKQVRIGVNEDGQRVDRIVAKLIPNAGKGLVYKAIRKKIITLNGKKTEPDVRVKEGDELKLFFADDTLRELGGTAKAADTPAPRNTVVNGYVFSENIIHEDEDVILVYKPAGILSQGADVKNGKPVKASGSSAAGTQSEVSLNDMLIAYLNEKGSLCETGETFRPSVCNRLDRNTSGIVVCGCSLKGLRVMSGLIHDRKMEKFYLCAVKGVLDEPGDLKGWLVKDEKTNKVRVCKEKPDVPGALNIETRFRPLKTARDMTLLEVELVTGRPHQIRAHMASIGHPVAGDSKYGDSAFNRRLASEFGIRHQLLVAWRLRFPLLDDLKELSGREFRCKTPGFVQKLFDVRL